ncbi:DUF4407 domain-containing protein [Streptosporangium sp. NPDC051022]|uniref:DUF4407 domain-containing protein n=1 Tax=Streptosporangium sp. NPDC051022 TaxID=3155752 RepID=UPI00342221EF
MRKLLITLSGARPEIVGRCPTESGKFEGLGGAILTTGLLASVSMWFALSSTLGISPLIAVPTALTWGLAIMSLDRWLVASMPTEGRRRWSLAVPRMVLALFLGVVISTPLVLQIFRSEIDAQITEIHRERADVFVRDLTNSAVGQQVASLRTTVTTLQNIIGSNGDTAIDPAGDPLIKSLTQEREQQRPLVDRYYTEWQCQLYGGPKCPKKGSGPLARAAEKSYREAAKRFEALNTQIDKRKQDLVANDDSSKKARLEQAVRELPQAQEQLNAAVRRQTALQEAFDTENLADNGLLIRLRALGMVSGREASLNTARILLFLFFLLIECLPITVKLMQRPGNYERILALAEQHEYRMARETYSGLRASPGPAATLWEIWRREPLSASPSTVFVSQPAELRTGPVTAAADDEDAAPLEDSALRSLIDVRTERPGTFELFPDDDDF